MGKTLGRLHIITLMAKTRALAQNLFSHPTFMTTFMVDVTTNRKTLQELLAIFEACSPTYSPDPSNDLRTLGFIQDMKNCSWTDDIELILNPKGEIIDGIHRGIAYLKCVKDGVSETSLPAVYLSAP